MYELCHGDTTVSEATVFSPVHVFCLLADMFPSTREVFYIFQTYPHKQVTIFGVSACHTLPQKMGKKQVHDLHPLEPRDRIKIPKMDSSFFRILKKSHVVLAVFDR